ncbi:Xaa-Pro dipeptidyl-peptidase [Thermomonospora catenispora]|uniref:Xaa-Pro dipeptidyl-peptidase n=1 Tax=Thermomonospora catenispora TaxID=2493090 RepID=UPI00112418DF|nr:Xaa-Pro dipeptidyl-peptidase [Thermomonospora catenispora]TNY36497.1 Xaa-Pro dipeptidyl-peptidase [Thermomonospora catenispora]
MARSYPRWAAAGALASGALLVATAGTAHAVAPPRIVIKDGVTQPVFSYADAIRERVLVESPVDSDGDGRRDLVNVDIIRPRETERGLKVPVIIDESPYYDNAGRGNESERKRYDADGNPITFPLFYDNYFVPRGYAFLAVDMIGTTRSDGCPTSGGAPDVLGGKAVIDWLNGRAKAYRPDGRPVRATWTTGNAAMIGKSYDGTLANGVAATGVKGLKTIVPIAAISSWYNYSRSNGVKYWTDEQPWLADYVDTDPPEKCAAVRRALDEGEDDATGNYNDYWAESNYRHGTIGDVGNVRASVFAVHTVNDLNVKADHFSLWWKGLAARGVPRKVWIAQYGHVDPFDFRRDVWVRTLHRWFDHELHGVRNGIMNEPRADVEIGPNRWITQSDWPAPGALPLTLRPGADGGLGLKPAPKGSTAVFTDAPGDEGAGVTEAQMVADPTAARPYRLAYVSPPLPVSARLSGTPTVTLRIKLDKPTANLTALLVDYGEDTRVDYLGPGSGIRTLDTESCHGEGTPDDDPCYRETETVTVTSPVNVVARGWIDAQNRHSLSRPTPLAPGRYHTVRWQTLPQDYVFKPGHRIALILAGTDADYNTETPTGARVTVDLSGTSVTVPVVPAKGSAADLIGPQTLSTWRGPTEVTLPRQPWRFF